MCARVLFFLLFWASVQPLSPFQAGTKERSANEEDVGRGAVERVLRTQEEAWNRQDLEAFSGVILQKVPKTFDVLEQIVGFLN